MRQILAPALFLVASLSATATTIRVPQDQPTIQAGINAASSGDTVLVAAGTYTGSGNRDITFQGKAITVQSETGAANTILDLQSAGRGFLFNSRETTASVLNGFTIKNGSAPGIFPNNSGGAIFCNGGSPTITNMVLTSNRAGWGGGAIQVQDASPIIQNSTITQNQAGYAGGIGIVGGNPIIQHNTITANKAISYDGGGIYARNASTPQILANLIAKNTANWNGGGIFLISASPVITNNIIVQNQANDDGGGIYAQNFSAPTLFNDTISGNSATHGGAIAARLGSRVVGVNMILWQNAPTETYTELVSSIALDFSDVTGGYPGTSNLNADPRFVNASALDYHIQDSSPCVSVGVITLGVPYDDIDGDVRPNPQSNKPDLGADENPN